MTHIRFGRRARTAAAALALAAAPLPWAEARGAAPRPAPAQEPGIYPVLVVSGESAQGATLQLHLNRVGVPDRIASFQGELRYDASRVTVQGGQLPPGVTGNWNEQRPGVVRFAGVAMAGLEGGAVLTLSVRAAQPLAADLFELRVEELVSHAGFRDLRPLVRQRGTRPALSRAGG